MTTFIFIFRSPSPIEPQFMIIMGKILRIYNLLLLHYGKERLLRAPDYSVLYNLDHFTGCTQSKNNILKGTTYIAQIFIERCISPRLYIGTSWASHWLKFYYSLCIHKNVIFLSFFNQISPEKADRSRFSWLLIVISLPVSFSLLFFYTQSSKDLAGFLEGKLNKKWNISHTKSIYPAKHQTALKCLQ